MKSKKLVFALTALCLVPTVAWANIGLPMISVTFRLMVAAFIPIVLIEAHFFRKILNVGKFDAKIMSLLANLVSTVIGIPVTWLGLVFLQTITGGDSAYGLDTFFQKFLAVTWQAPWLVPYAESELHWMIPTAMLVLLIPYFFASWIIESWVLENWLKETCDRSLVWRACLIANIVTYCLMALVPVGKFVTTYLQ